MQLSKKARTNLVGYAFILPNIIGTVLFIVLPLLFSLVISFTSWDFVSGIKGMKFIGLQNYIDQWSDKWFVDSLRNTIVYAAAVVPITVFLALVFAVLIEKYAYAKTPLKLAAFMPYISNVVAVAIVWKMMLAKKGPFTLLVKSLGWANPPAWLASYEWALPAIILLEVWSGIGYCIMIYSSAIQGLSQDLYEAAEVDGASAFRQFFSITVPGLSPTTFFLVATRCIHSFQIFAPIQIMTRGGPGTSTHVLVYYIYTTAFTFYKMGYACSISWILCIILIVFTMIQWQGQRKWVSYQ